MTLPSNRQWRGRPRGESGRAGTAGAARRAGIPFSRVVPGRVGDVADHGGLESSASDGARRHPLAMGPATSRHGYAAAGGGAATTAGAGAVGCSPTGRCISRPAVGVAVASAPHRCSRYQGRRAGRWAGRQPACSPLRSRGPLSVAWGGGRQAGGRGRTRWPSRDTGAYRCRRAAGAGGAFLDAA